METNLLTIEQAKKLKELGFPQNIVKAGYTSTGNEIHHCGDYCLMYGCDNNCDDPHFNSIICSAPTLDEASKWFREEKNLYISVSPNDFKEDNFYYVIIDCVEGAEYSRGRFYTYEEAMMSAICECIEIVISWTERNK